MRNLIFLPALMLAIEFAKAQTSPVKVNGGYAL
jgi:hypothetical protein